MNVMIYVILTIISILLYLLAGATLGAMFLWETKHWIKRIAFWPYYLCLSLAGKDKGADNYKGD